MHVRNSPHDARCRCFASQDADHARRHLNRYWYSRERQSPAKRCAPCCHLRVLYIQNPINVLFWQSAISHFRRRTRTFSTTTTPALLSLTHISDFHQRVNSLSTRRKVQV